jgi:hypothetical protein
MKIEHIGMGLKVWYGHLPEAKRVPIVEYDHHFWAERHFTGGLSMDQEYAAEAESRRLCDEWWYNGGREETEMPQKLFGLRVFR